MRAPDIQTDFGAGEFAPEMYGRVDLPDHARACSRLQNAIPLPGGGVQRIGGTEAFLYLGENLTRSNVCVPHFECVPVGSYGGYYALVVGAQMDYDPDGSTCNGIAHRLSITNLTSNPYGTHTWATKEYNYTLTTSTAISGSRWEDISYSSNCAAYNPAINYSGLWCADNANTEVVIGAHSTALVWQFVDPTKKDVRPTGGQNPGAIGAYQGRLVFGSGIFDTYLWASRPNDFGDLSTTSTSVSAWQFVLPVENSIGVRWLVDQETLLVGAAGAEVEISASGGGAVTASSAQARTFSRLGSMVAKARLVGDRVIFPSKPDSSLRSYAYMNDYQAYRAQNLSEQATHLTERTITAMDIQPSSDGAIIWCVLADGGMVGCRYNVMTNKTAWFELDREDDMAYCNVAVMNLADYVPGEHVFVAVRRGTKYYAERLYPTAPVSYADGYRGYDNRPPWGEALTIPYLRHCGPDLFRFAVHDALQPAGSTSYFYHAGMFRRKIESVEQDPAGTGKVKITIDNSAKVGSTYYSVDKWRVYGNRRYSDYHETDFMLEFDGSTHGTYATELITSHTSALTLADADGDLGWLQGVCEFAKGNVAAGSTVLNLNMEDGSDYYAVCDGEIFAENCKLDANGVLVDSSTSTTVGIRVYGANLYYGCADQIPGYCPRGGGAYRGHDLSGRLL